MAIKAVLFDLDGTLLPMDQDVFIGAYFKLLAAKLAPFGYEPEKLIDSVWKGTAAMIKNDGSCKNEDAFWRVFTEIHGETSLKDKSIIDGFYSQEFNQVKGLCGFAKEAKEVVELVKTSGKRAVLATNPLFPAVATENRMRWAGLEPTDFEYYTTYENSCYCKPNPEYYKEILKKLKLEPSECIMIGNDISDDMVATEKLGMKVFLLTDCLINKAGEDITQYPNGSFGELKEFLKEMLS